MKPKVPAYILISVLCLLSSELSANKLPAWLKQIVHLEADFGQEPSAFVLEDYSRRAYLPKQVIETTVRYAIKFNDLERKELASLQIPILSKSHKTTTFKAWMIYEDGRIESFKKLDTFTLGDLSDSLVSEARRQILDRTESVRPKAIFAYEYVTKSDSVFTDERWFFQSSVPTYRSRFEIQFPSDWTIDEPIYAGAVNVESGKTGNLYYWEAHKTPAVKIEEAQPPRNRLLTQLLVQVHPSEKRYSRNSYLRFNTWEEVAGYAKDIHDQQATLSPQMLAEARAITAPYSNEWDKIQAICAYLQSINYVSIAIDISKGGGFIPRPASEVMASSWGDCKDMSVLAIALFRAADIEAYPVLTRIGEDSHIDQEWVSPSAFNHCIVGIETDPPIPASDAMIENTVLGSILIFDPTDQYSPVGHLSDSLFGSKVLIGDNRIKNLHRIPDAQPKDRSIHRSIEAHLLDNGYFKGTLTETLEGVVASYIRSLTRNKSEKELRSFVQEWISRGLPHVQIGDISIRDEFEENRLNWTIEFRSSNFAKTISGTDIITLKPIFISPHMWTPPIRDDRSTPFISSAWSYNESITIHLPESLSIDYLPQSSEVSSPYGTYTLTNEAQENQISVTRIFHSEGHTHEPESYEKIVDFFLELQRLDNSQVVLTK